MKIKSKKSVSAVKNPYLLATLAIFIASFLITFIMLLKRNITIPKSTVTTISQNIATNCYYKNLPCKSSVPNCTSSILVCPGFISPTPTPNQVGISIVGLFSQAECSKLVGWAYEAANPKRIMQISLYADGPNKAGSYIGTVYANSSGATSLDVTTSYGNHGFYYITPLWLQNEQPHTIYAYVKDPYQTATPQLLLGSPKSIFCNFPPTQTPTPSQTPTPTATPITTTVPPTVTPIQPVIKNTGK